MHPRKNGLAWLACLALFCLPQAASAENSKEFGNYVVHYNALMTDMLPPPVARQYHITRSRHRGMLNIVVLKKVLGTTGQPVPAFVDVGAVNLAMQTKGIRMREIRDGNAIYYIGDFGVANEETLKFDIKVRPVGTLDDFEFSFSQDFYTK